MVNVEVGLIFCVLINCDSNNSALLLFTVKE